MPSSCHNDSKFLFPLVTHARQLIPPICFSISQLSSLGSLFVFFCLLSKTIWCSCETRWETWCLSLHRFSACLLLHLHFFQVLFSHFSPLFSAVVFVCVYLSLLFLPHPFLSISVILCFSTFLFLQTPLGSLLPVFPVIYLDKSVCVCGRCLHIW